MSGPLSPLACGGPGALQCQRVVLLYMKVRLAITGRHGGAASTPAHLSPSAMHVPTPSERICCDGATSKRIGRRHRLESKRRPLTQPAHPRGSGTAWRAKRLHRERAGRAAHGGRCRSVWCGGRLLGMSARRNRRRVDGGGPPCHPGGSQSTGTAEVEQLPAKPRCAGSGGGLAPQLPDDVRPSPPSSTHAWLRHILAVARHREPTWIPVSGICPCGAGLLVPGGEAFPRPQTCRDYPAMVRLRRSTGPEGVLTYIVRNPAAAQRIMNSGAASTRRRAWSSSKNRSTVDRHGRAASAGRPGLQHATRLARLISDPRAPLGL